MTIPKQVITLVIAVSAWILMHAVNFSIGISLIINKSIARSAGYPTREYSPFSFFIVNFVILIILFTVTGGIFNILKKVGTQKLLGWITSCSMFWSLGWSIMVWLEHPVEELIVFWLLISLVGGAGLILLYTSICAFSPSTMLFLIIIHIASVLLSAFAAELIKNTDQYLLIIFTPGLIYGLITGFYIFLSIFNYRET